VTDIAMVCVYSGRQHQRPMQQYQSINQLK